MKKWIWLPIVMLLSDAISCNQAVVPPERAKGIPMEAQWAGGPDGGAWILCTVVEGRNRCAIYDDYTGKLWATGDFVLEGTENGVAMDELKYAGFDGVAIHLEDGRVLVLMQQVER